MAPEDEYPLGSCTRDTLGITNSNIIKGNGNTVNQRSNGPAPTTNFNWINGYRNQTHQITITDQIKRSSNRNEVVGDDNHTEQISVIRQSDMESAVRQRDIGKLKLHFHNL
jgi:hypothetical protein